MADVLPPGFSGINYKLYLHITETVLFAHPASAGHVSIISCIYI